MLLAVLASGDLRPNCQGCRKEAMSGTRASIRAGTRAGTRTGASTGSDAAPSMQARFEDSLHVMPELPGFADELRSLSRECRRAVDEHVTWLEISSCTRP